MKRAIVLTIAALFAVGMSASAVTVSTTIYPGLNLIAPPLVPFNPDPLEVFKDNAGNPIDIDLKLTRWDAAGQGYISYDMFGDPSQYGGVLLGDGTWLRQFDTLVWQYDGAPDGLPDSGGTMTDMWISLPSAGLTMVGHPFNHNVVYADCLMTDGTQTVTLEQARTNGWTDGVASEWDAAGQGYNLIEIDPWGVYLELQPFHGYWIRTTQPNLALIIPAYPPA